MSILSDKISAADDRPVTSIEVPEWGMTLRVRELSLGQHLEYTRRLADHAGDFNTIAAWLMVLSVVDDAGNLALTEADVPMLLTKSLKVVGRIFQEITEANSVTEADVEAAVGE